MTDQLNIQYKIAKLHLSDFVIKDEVLDGSDIEVSVNTEFQFEYEKTQNIIASRVNVVYSNNNGDFMKASMDGFFLIHPDSIKALTLNDKIVFPNDFLVQIASITYGSMRGALCVKTEGMFANNYPLPPLYVQKVVDGDLVMDL